MSNTEQEAQRLQFQTIKNRFESYEARRNKVIANQHQMLRAQVESSFTPSYVDGSYVKPVAVVEKNNLPIEGTDHLWRMWFLDLDEATAALNVSVVIDLDGETKTVNVNGLDASVDYVTFLDNFVAGFTSDDVTVVKHCDKCVVLSEKAEGTEICGVTVTVS